MGSNMAEAHPVGFQWVMEAKANDATVIHIDPRFTRTSALSDLHVPLRTGTDIAFLGGVINYILAHELDFREYLLAYTNASFLVSEDYQDTEDLDGLFSGYHEETTSYDSATWHYEGVSARPSPGTRHPGEARETSAAYQHGSGGPVLEGVTEGIAADPTLRDPRCVS
jgi:formate dehydrogenase major subunit